MTDSITCHITFLEVMGEVEVFVRYAKSNDLSCIEKQIVVSDVIRVAVCANNIVDILALQAMELQA